VRKHPLAICEQCPFQYEPFVPTQNPHPKSKIAVIGEAPGAYEAANGIPFTGPSGRLLDQVLAHHGYNRSEIFVSNIALCRPENNDDPPKAAIAACKPRLDAEIALSGVEKIIAVGGTAASALIDPRRKISSLRVGPPKPYIENPNISVVATWHPAFCLRTSDAFPSFVSDIGKLNGAKNQSWEKPSYKAFDDPDTVIEVIKRLSSLSNDQITIDIETGMDKDETYEHPDQHNLLCIGIGYDLGKVVILGEQSLKNLNVQSALGDYLRSRSITAHNGKSDLAGLYPIFGRLHLSFDTMLASYSIDERPGYHTLEKVAVEYVGAPLWKHMILPYLDRGKKDFSQIPRKILYEYNALDVHNTDLVRRHFSFTMDHRQWKEHNFLVKAANAIIDLERAGIAFDSLYNQELGEEFEKELFNIELRINEVAGVNLNPRSPMQIARYLGENGLSVATTEAKALTAILERLSFRSDDKSRKISEFLTQLLLHRKHSKLYGTYVKGFRGRSHNGKIYTTYTLHGTTSGRLASKNPNMQNISRDKRIKHQFTVEVEGKSFVHVDYKQAEGRVITTLAHDEYLRSIFCDSSRDIFDELTDQIYGYNNWGKEERVKIKTFFYGLSYGRKAPSIALAFKMPLGEARELLENFKSLIPATVSWQASVTQKVLSGEDLITPFGRKRSFWLITDQNREDVLNEALSFLPQSIASDICLSALIELQPRLVGLATTRLTIHDALIFECKDSDVDEVAEIAREEMMAAGKRFTDYVPFAVDVSTGKRWSEL
jgi:uracil-DNA glycosylase family 4